MAQVLRNYTLQYNSLKTSISTIALFKAPEPPFFQTLPERSDRGDLGGSTKVCI